VLKTNIVCIFERKGKDNMYMDLLDTCGKWWISLCCHCVATPSLLLVALLLLI